MSGGIYRFSLERRPKSSIPLKSAAILAATTAVLALSMSPVGAKVIREDYPQIEGAPAVHLYQWRDPAIRPKAVALAIHGLVMHGATYDKLARELASKGVIVVAQDMHGYGRWYKEPPARNKMTVQVAIGKQKRSARKQQEAEKFATRIFEELHGDNSETDGAMLVSNESRLAQLSDDLVSKENGTRMVQEATASSAINLIGPPREMGLDDESVSHLDSSQRLRGGTQTSNLQDSSIRYPQSYKELVQLSGALRNKYPSLPLYCIGESLGAAMALHLASDVPDSIDGLVLSSPAVKRRLFYFAPALVKDVLTVMARPFPLFQQVDVSPYIKRWASEDPRTCDATVEDPLVRKRLSTYDLLLTMKEVRATTRYARRIPSEMPVLIMQGDKDRMIRANGVVTLMTHLKSSDETIKWFNGKGHLLLETPYVMPETVETVSGWLLQHASAAKQITSTN